MLSVHSSSFPGEDNEAVRLRAYLSGLWLDAGYPSSRQSSL